MFACYDALTALVCFISTSLSYNEVASVMKEIYIDRIGSSLKRNQVGRDADVKRGTEVLSLPLPVAYRPV